MLTPVTLAEGKPVWPLGLRGWLTELLAGLESVGLQCGGLELG